MNPKNLMASLVTAFALVSGSAYAAEAEPVAPDKAMQAATANFDNHKKDVVLERTKHRDVQTEPLLIRRTGDSYLIHESGGVLDAIRGEGVGHLKRYNQDELVKEHGPLEEIRTYGQYKADSEILATTPGLGRNTAGSSIDMKTRIEDIKRDMKAAGEEFEPAPKQKQPAPSR